MDKVYLVHGNPRGPVAAFEREEDARDFADLYHHNSLVAVSEVSFYSSVPDPTNRYRVWARVSTLGNILGQGEETTHTLQSWAEAIGPAMINRDECERGGYSRFVEVLGMDKAAAQKLLDEKVAEIQRARGG